MRILKRIAISLICAIATIGVVVVGGYIFVRSKYDIDLFRTVGQLKVLTETPNESAICPNAFGAEDFVGVKNTLNTGLVDGFVTFAEGEGYEGYGVDFTATSSITDISGFDSLKISEKEAGALGQIIFHTQTGGVVNVNGNDLKTCIKQMDFSNISESGGADINIVVEVDLTPFAENMVAFPFNLLRRYIPDRLYISSTVSIQKTDGTMGYKTSHKELRISNLSAEETADLFHTLDTVLVIGSAKDVNMSIGNTVAQVLIGDDTNFGFAYSLREIFHTFNFRTIEGVDYFVLEN